MSTTYSRKKRRCCCSFFAGTILFYLCGGFSHLFSRSFDSDFDYPYSGNVRFLVDQIMNNGAEFTPTNTFDYEYKTNCSHVCGANPIKLLFLIKSSPENYDKRNAIRNTWGSPDSENIKTVFLIGERPSETQKLNEESRKFNDLIQGNFTDAYFNNTLKTMMGFSWAFHFCKDRSDYFMFVDDDYFVSPKNVLTFVKNPYNYPGRDPTVRKFGFIDFSPDKFQLYAGFVFESSPFRSFFSKWHVSLDEYPYDKWPPYVTAGSYVLSSLSLKRMFYASLFTKSFRFDDIYIGIIAYKLSIDPIHNDNFYFYKKNPLDDRNVIASHDYEPDELLKVWSKL